MHSLCGGEVSGALTGRLVYRSLDFLSLGGYDENGTPSGGQDVDMRTRLEFLFFRHNAKTVPKSVPCPRVMNFDVCGGAAPNDWDADPDDKKHDRGFSKVMHCSPEELASLTGPDNKKWCRMNEKGWAYFAGLLDKNVIHRNKFRSTEAGPLLGCWWTKLHAPDMLEKNMSLMADFLPAALTQEQKEALVARLVEHKQQAALATPHVSIPRHVSKARVEIHVVFAGLKNLWYIRRSITTFLYEKKHAALFHAHKLQKTQDLRRYSCGRLGSRPCLM